MDSAIVTILTRPGCHLCEEAKEAMLSSASAVRFELREINIESDPESMAHYQNDIPVVFINGVKAFKHRVDPKEFRRKLKRLAGR